MSPKSLVQNGQSLVGIADIDFLVICVHELEFTITN